jgi:hypothetical protein
VAKKITLRAAIDGGHAVAVRVHCPCGHVGELAIIPLADKLGVTATFNDVERLGRCECCGGRTSIDARPVYTAIMGLAGASPQVKE